MPRMTPVVTVVLCYLPLTPFWPIAVGLFIWGTKKSEATKADLTLAKYGFQAFLIGLFWLLCLPLIPVWLVASIILFFIIIIVLLVIGTITSWLGVGVLVYAVAVVVLVIAVILVVGGALVLAFCTIIGGPLLLLLAMALGIWKVNDESFRGLPPFTLLVRFGFRGKKYAGAHDDLVIDTGRHPASDVEEGEVEDGEVIDSSDVVEASPAKNDDSRSGNSSEREEGELSSTSSG